jgi:3D (Asp-Asp-Asp) domain-containing protein
MLKPRKGRFLSENMRYLHKNIKIKLKESIKKGGNYALSIGLALNVAAAAAPSLSLESGLHDSLSEALSVTTLVSANQPTTRKIMSVTLTAYSSTPDQTDDTPFIAASGAHVYDGMIAANFLPFGTKVQIPKLFGDKIFTVDDRMNRRFTDRVDIWFPDRESAIQFGIKTAEIIILL